MRIAICGSQSTGKTSLIESVKAIWPMYKSPEKTYRELIKEKNLPINKQGTLAAQKEIRDALCDQAINNAGEKFRIDDRSILDNIVYSLWMAEKGKFTEPKQEVTAFISDSILIMRNTLKLYDVIFYSPVDPSITIEAKDQRDTDPDFREEIDSIFYGIYMHYRNGDEGLFDMQDTPPIIELPYSLQERIDTLKFYINDNGNPVETEKSVLSEIADMEIPQNLLKQVMGKGK